MTDKERYENLLSELKKLIEKYDCKCVNKSTITKINKLSNDNFETR